MQAQGSATGFADGTGTLASLSIHDHGIPLTAPISMWRMQLNHTIRKIVISTGVVTTLAGSTTSTSQALADGTGTSARFNYPAGGITIDGNKLYVADTNNHKIRKIVISTGEVTTFAGSAAGSTTSGSTNGTGTSARFNKPP